MKKITRFFSLLILGLLCTVGVNAQYVGELNLKLSDDTSEFWYYIKSQRGSTPAAVYVQDMGADNQVLNKVVDYTLISQLWKVVKHSSDKGYSLKSKAGHYMNADITSGGNINAIVAEPTSALTIKLPVTPTTPATYLIENDPESTPAYRIHAGNGGANWGLMNWTGDANDNCSFEFIALDYPTIIADYIADMQSVIDNAAIGEDPGQYSQDVVDALAEVKTAAKEYDAASKTDEENYDYLVNTLVVAMNTYKASMSQVKISDSSVSYWYYMKNADPGRGGKVMCYDAANTAAHVRFADQKIAEDTQIFRFLAGDDSKIYIENKACGLQLKASVNNSTPIGIGAAGDQFVITYLGSLQFTMNVTGYSHLHAAASGTAIVPWSGGLNSASAWMLLSYDPAKVLTNTIAEATESFDKMPKGTKPGEFSPSTESAFAAIIDNAKSYDSSSATDDEKIEFAKNLKDEVKLFFNTNYNPIRLSSVDGEKEYWYGISGVFDYVKGWTLYIADSTSTEFNLHVDTIANNPMSLFKFVDAGDGKAYIQNKGTGLYIHISGSAVVPSETSSSFNLNFLGGDAQFSFNVDGSSPLHAQNNGKKLVTWSGGLNSASAFKLFEAPSKLGELIGLIEGNLGNVHEKGDGPGQYPAAAYDILTAAIAAAKLVDLSDSVNIYKDNYATEVLTPAYSAFLLTVSSLKLSNDSTEYWYYLKGQRGIRGLYLESRSEDSTIISNVKDLMGKTEQLWKIVKHPAGTGFLLKNGNGRYVDANNTLATTVGSDRLVTFCDTVPESYFTFATSSNDVVGYFIRNAAKTISFHTGGANHDNRILSSWFDANDNCTFFFEEFDKSEVLTQMIVDAEFIYAEAFVGENPGQYTETTCATLRSAINAAVVFKDDSASSPEDKYEYASDVLLVAINTFKESMNTIKMSDSEAQHWYYIQSAATTATYAIDKVICYDEANSAGQVRFAPKAEEVDMNQLFIFTKGDDNKVYIVLRSRDDLKLTASVANSTAIGLSLTGDQFVVTSLGSQQFTINVTGHSTLHAAASGTVVVPYPGGLNSASAWKFLYYNQTTDIKDSLTTDEKNESIYDLSGRKVKDTESNKIYIINGKKKIVK